MKTKMLRRARALWASGDRRLDRHNQRAWIRSIRHLGPRWLRAEPRGPLSEESRRRAP
jgi:hypothetical protein